MFDFGITDVIYMQRKGVLIARAYLGNDRYTERAITLEEYWWTDSRADADSEED